ncbi:MAG: serine O-acetyltransferase [Saprospiraceae bacterium]|jgi:serine O-acetyltransferase
MAKNQSIECLWKKIQDKAEEVSSSEPALGSYMQANILSHDSLSSALGLLLAQKLQCASVPEGALHDIFHLVFSANASIQSMANDDIQAITQRDSACHNFLSAFMYYKGFHALQAWRASHWLWEQGRKSLALMLQNRISVVFGVDIHPAAQIGKGVMFDHATGIVIGETAVIEDCVSILQGVTLGGTGKKTGDRHPKVRRGVLIGPGATILGNIEIGEGSKIIAASVVLKDIPPHTIASGVPAEVIDVMQTDSPAEKMDQSLSG